MVKKGCMPWNRGLTKKDPRVKAYTDKKIGKIRLDIIGHKWNVGRKQSLSTREKRSVAVKKFWEENKDSEKVLIRNKKISEKMLGRKKNYQVWSYIDGRSQNSIPRKMIKGKLVSRIVWCKTNEIHRVPDGCVIHHINLNPKNNSPENLQLLEDKYHRILHNKIIKIMKGGGIVAAM